MRYQIIDMRLLILALNFQSYSLKDSSVFNTPLNPYFDKLRTSSREGKLMPQICGISNYFITAIFIIFVSDLPEVEVTSKCAK
jgi:hypothetical protein